MRTLTDSSFTLDPAHPLRGITGHRLPSSVTPWHRWLRMVRAIGAAIRRMVAQAKRRRAARGAYLALRVLDAHALRDLGFHPSELASVAPELSGVAEATRVRMVQVLRDQR